MAVLTSLLLGLTLIGTFTALMWNVSLGNKQWLQLLKSFQGLVHVHEMKDDFADRFSQLFDV